MIDNRLVGKRIASLRQGNALTQQQLASMMNVSHQAVSKWESGQALPDIQTMLELTRFFGITVEQLTSSREDAPTDTAPEAAEASIPERENEIAEDMKNCKEDSKQKEAKHMSIQQLLQMAPFMSKETVEEIAMEIEAPISAAQIARLAPFVRAECLEKLMEKHKPELSWDILRRIAPFMSRESVDQLAKDIASGKESVKSTEDSINKTINDIGKDIGKAFDDIGRGVGHAMKKAIRFGENVINEVSSAFSDKSEEPEIVTETHVRSERAVALRKKAFERALEDGKWDWIAAHISEVEGDAQLRNKIAARARDEGLNDWICKYMGGSADEYTVDAAIANGNWDWLGDNTWQMEDVMQEKVALAAAQAENWEWLSNYADQLMLKNCGIDIARAAMEKGEKELAVQIVENHLTPQDAALLAEEALKAQNYELLEALLALVGDETLEKLLLELAEKQEWQRIERALKNACAETVEALMEKAVDQGNFEAVDMIDRYL